MRAKRLTFLVLLSAAPLMSGCVERRFTVVSDPPGAMVLADRQEIGAAPVTLPSRASTYYGTREFMLVKDGFEPLLVRQPVPAPWWGYFPFDFFAENVWPGNIVDERTFTYQLQPLKVVPPETVLQSANGARSRAAGIGVLPAEHVLPPTANGLPPGALPAQPAVPAPAPPSSPPPNALPPSSPPPGDAAPGRTTGARLEFD